MVVYSEFRGSGGSIVLNRLDSHDYYTLFASICTYKGVFCGSVYQGSWLSNNMIYLMNKTPQNNNYDLIIGLGFSTIMLKSGDGGNNSACLSATGRCPYIYILHTTRSYPPYPAGWPAPHLRTSESSELSPTS